MTLKLRNLTVLLLLGMLVSCTSRYRLNLYLIQGESRDRVKIEKTEFITEGVLNDPFAKDKVVTGRGNCIILLAGRRGETVETNISNLVGYDQYLKYKLYLQAPSRLESGTIPLTNSSFVQVLGQYDRTTEERMYIARSGTFVIDSVSGDHLYGSVNGSYQNRPGDELTFEGKFKVKVFD